MTRHSGPDDRWPRGWDEHRRAQAALGLRLTPAERLRWLEETMATLRRWVGRARHDPVLPAPGAAEPASSYTSTGRSTDPTGPGRTPSDEA